ncbi:hypothetical protein H671_1g0480 [Cricetulus griseus]|nr:hypothetical protein H671_1g0480 [Cricetulus griseus]
MPDLSIRLLLQGCRSPGPQWVVPSSFFCPANTSSVAGNECPAGHYCPASTTFASQFPCPRGMYKPQRGGVHRSDCSPCEPGTGKRFPDGPCLAGYYCPPGQTSATPMSFRCPQGFYCPEGSPQPKACGNGTFQPQEAQGSCELCPMGFYCEVPSTGNPNRDSSLWCLGQSMSLLVNSTYRSPALDTLTCQPCPPGFICPQGSSTCTCRGLNRIFQKSDGSCICQAGHVSYDDRGLESDQESDSHSDEDCQPQVAQHCPPGDVRLAATRECVSPQQYDCTSFCGPGGGRLSAPLGICQCLGYVSAEELCDIRCLANAPRLSLSWDPGKEVILSVKSETGDSIQKELLETLGPDLQFPGSSRVHLVQFGPHGTFGFIISRVDMLNYLLQGTAVSSPWLQRHHRATDPKYPNIVPQIPNPVICLAAGDVILFQLHLLPHNRLASHYPMYQRQHLLNSNSHWDSGAFRRLGHLVRETNLSLSRFAHQFLDPGTYVFQDNGNPENIAVVSVKEEGAACGAGLSPVQPSSPYQLGRLGVLRHRMLRLGPDWAVITGVLLAAGLATALLTGLGLLLKPAVPQTCPTKSWGSQWRSMGQPHTLAAHISLRDNLTVRSPLIGDPLQTLTLEDFSVRTLYDKLEDQSLHIAAQLSRHRKDALAFYGAASQQLQALQGISLTELPSLVRDKHSEPEVKTRMETITGESEEPQEGRASYTAASQTESWQLDPGYNPNISPLGFQSELNRAISALASVLSQASSQHDAQSCFTGQKDSPTMGQPPFHDQEPQMEQPPFHDQEPQRPRPQQDIKGQDAQTLNHEKWILGAGLRHRPDVELQKKTWQVEEALDKLNEEFFWLSAQALELQKKGDKLDRLPLGEDNISMWAAVKLVPPAEYQVQDAALVLSCRE